MDVVHRETVDVGPYRLTLGFSRWPMQEGRSFDLLIDPAGGIAGKSGTITVLTPAGRAIEDSDGAPLVRFPRQRTSWGLDVVSFEGDGAGGRWSIKFSMNGPQGPGQGRLAVLPMGPLPGPPRSLSWLLAAVPVLLLGLTLSVAWLRIRPGRVPGAWALGPDPARAPAAP